jgi:Na+/melibiose symporter-like transporter
MAQGMPVESVVFALLLITSVLVLPFWSWMAKHFYKNIAYIFGMFFGAVVQLLVFTV